MEYAGPAHGGYTAARGGTGPGRPREERATGAVLKTVVDLITEQGIGAVTMDAVAARAWVSKPAIHRRWPTKQDLIIAAPLRGFWGLRLVRSHVDASRIRQRRRVLVLRV
ncbi:helix-turn-helix domain-containing protein [Streptomyces lutosisoli]|uniref:helix-turn-helix domain-containing protein n=1 Tax=Streptomyces lutosisoli TaxID=2665721 RepID=UPI00361443A9